MKKILLLLFIIKTVLPASAQSIPEIISQNMSTSFASATNIEWNELSEGRYRANFIQNGIDKSALFSNTGNLLQLMFPVAPKDFPIEVNNSILKRFPGYEVMEALRVEISQEVTFKIKIRKGKEVFEVVIDVFGKIKRQIKIAEEIAYEGCEKGDEEAYCERHGKKHKVKHSKKDKSNKKNQEEISSL